MANNEMCPGCGKPIPPDALQGLCPECLLEESLRPDTEGSPVANFVPPAPEELAPHFLKLEILELIGQGGMGAVYKARQKDLDRIVALKILPPAAGRDPGFAERFAREACNQAKLHHSNIVTVFEYGRASDYYFFVMEWVDGTNLRERIGQIQPADALNIIPQICEALQYAHDEGIIHRDIKPDNILIDQKGRVKIADFGIAKLREPAPGNATITDSGQLLGTRDYMAPEQRDHGSKIDHRADIYSLGVVFYEMLTGHRPRGKFASPSQKVAVDPRVDEVVFRALEELPERRYQKVKEIKAAVDVISTRRKRPLVIFVVVGLLVTLSGWLALSRSNSHAPPRPKPPSPAPITNETKWTTPGDTLVSYGRSPFVAYETGATKTVHLAYSILNDGFEGLWHRRTTNYGKNWTGANRVASAVPLDNASVAAADGTVVVVWYDRKTKSVAANYSKNGGLSWSSATTLIEGQDNVTGLSVWPGADPSPKSFVITFGNNSLHFIEYFGDNRKHQVAIWDTGARYSFPSYVRLSTQEVLTVIATTATEARELFFVRDIAPGASWEKRERRVSLDAENNRGPARIVNADPPLTMACAVGDSDGFVHILWGGSDRPLRIYQMGERRPVPLQFGFGHNYIPLAFDGDGQGNGVIAWASAQPDVKSPAEIHALFLNPVPKKSVAAPRIFE